MPIIGYNQDGTVKIARADGTDVLDVKPEELVKYNPKLSTEYQKHQSEVSLATSGDIGLSDLAKTDPIAAAQAKQAGAKSAPTKDQQAQKVKQDIIDVAKNLQEVIANKDQYDPKTYQDTKNALASRIILKKKEADNLGAALSGNELGILSGQVPVTQTIGASFPQKVGAFFTGKQPVQHGEVVDDDPTLQNKMKLLIAGLSGEKVTADIFSKPAKKGQTPQDYGIDTKNIPKRLAEGADKNIQGLMGNVQVSKNPLINAFVNATPIKYGVGAAQVATHPIETAKAASADALATVGGKVSTNNGGLTVNFTPQTAINHAIDNPVNTALTVAAPLEAGVEGISGLVKGKLPPIESAPAVAETVATKGARVEPVSDIAGRAATKVATPDVSSVVKSEKIMSDALRTTDSVSRRGMARELELNIPKIGEKIDTYAKELDKTIGAQPVAELLGTIDENLAQSSPVQAHPTEYGIVKKMLQKDLTAGEMGSGADATNIAKINEARKNLNNSIPNAWFKNGMPTSSRTDVLNAIKWDMSNQLKDFMAEADKSGYFRRAIDMQHTAYQAGPALSNEALSSSGGMGRFGIIRSAWDKATSVPTVMGARAAQPARDALTQSILNGELPPITTSEAAPSAILKQAPMMENKPNGLPPITTGEGPSTSVGTGERLGGQSFVNENIIREVRDKKGKVIGLEKKTKNGDWVEYKPSVKNFKQK